MPWKDDRDLGPWEFNPRADKWGYLNNPRWTKDPSYERQQENIQFASDLGLSIDTPRHDPCGHWHKQPIINIPIEPLFIIHGSPTWSGSVEQDYCRKRSSINLSEIINYGGHGTGLDQLNCPFGICAGPDFIWICDVNNNRIMKRLKDDLTYVDHKSSFRRHCCHTDGELLWTGDVNYVDRLNMTTMSTEVTVQYNAAASSNVEGRAKYAADITADENFIYVADNYNCRILVLNKVTLAYVGEIGDATRFIQYGSGVFHDGTYLYVGDYGFSTVFKIRASDKEVIASIGHRNGGVGEIYNQFPQNVVGYDSLLYLPLVFVNKIMVRSQADLSYVADVDTNLAPRDVCCDDNYIYVSEDTAVEVFDRSSYAYVTTYTTTPVDPADMDSIWGICCDDNYFYIVDEGLNAVVKRNKSDFSYVGQYADPGYTNMWDAAYCAIDANYIYVSDQSRNVIHRINKSTMAYVDSFGTFLYPQGMFIRSGLIYVSNYGNTNNYTSGGILVYDLATLLLVEQAIPVQTPTPNTWIDRPTGITCDENYLYVTNRQFDGNEAEVIRFERSSLNFVDRTSLNSGTVPPYHIAVDNEFLYVAFYSNTLDSSFLKKFNKVTLVEVDVTTDHNQYVESVDEWYPWWDYIGGSSLDEPMIWDIDNLQ